MKNTLYIVIPCYNEEKVLNETIKATRKKINDLIKRKIISKDSKILFVNDGSSDNTWKLIENISKKDKNFTGISLSRNCGHQNALLAGLLTAKKYADIVISMDADLQDDINAIDEMIEKYYKGAEIVYGIRSLRKKDTWFKRTTAELFYKFMKLMGVGIVYNHADYRLTTRRVLEYLEKFNETNLFLRGIFPLIGFKNDIVYYERKERVAGESKYPLKKMLSFAWDGITSFTIIPIRFILFLGIILSIFNFLILIILIVSNLVNSKSFGIDFIICLICFLFGIQTIFIGIIGEYIGKTYVESKKRPRYIIEFNLLED